MKKLNKEYIDILEEREWRISDYTDDGRVELNWYSPAGEDIYICASVKDFPAAVYEYYENFDIDDHIELGIEARRNGVDGVPSVRRLVIDAEAIDEELETLALTLRGLYTKKSI